MRKISKIKLKTSASIKQALEIISRGAIQIAIVVDRNNKLVGTITDGDIRRGLLKGYDLNSSIKPIIFKKPIIAKESYNKEKLIKIALSKKIYQIPVVDKNYRPIGIHILNELIIPKKKTNIVVIMAGGRGKRLKPLTNNTPKPMLKVGNKPILLTIIEKFKDNGYKNFILCVNYKSEIIKRFFGNGKKFGVNIEYVKEKKRMGTAGALSFLKKKLLEPFFVMNGDLLTNLDFEKLLDFHHYHNSKATMCVSEYNIDSPYGEVKLDFEKIISIEEKPTHKFFVNAGVYVLDPKCLNLVPKKFYDMTTFFKDIISKNYKTASFPMGEYWLDIGKHNDYKKANIDYYNDL